MPSYQLSIITPEGLIFRDAVESIVAPGTLGFFGVLAHHAPMMASLKEGILKIQHANTEKKFQINSGILEVDNKSNVIVLVDQATTQSA